MSKALAMCCRNHICLVAAPLSSKFDLHNLHSILHFRTQNEKGLISPQFSVNYYCNETLQRVPVGADIVLYFGSSSSIANTKRKAISKKETALIIAPISAQCAAISGTVECANKLSRY